MKALEILQESKKMDESPPGALGQVGRRVGAAALGALGMKHTASAVRGKADLIAKSREYYAAYKKFLGRIGKSEKDADLGDLRDFYIKNGLPASDVPTSGPADRDTIFNILKKTASDDHRGRTTSSNVATSSSANTPNSGNDQSSSKLSFDQIQSAVDGLSSTEKAQLLNYLQSQTTASPSQIRQTKQSQAAQVAQAQMAATAPSTVSKTRKGRRRNRKAANVAV